MPAARPARSLARRAGLPVPQWFVLSAEAVVESLTPGQRIALENRTDSAAPRARAGGRCAGACHCRRGRRCGAGGSRRTASSWRCDRRPATRTAPSIVRRPARELPERPARRCPGARCVRSGGRASADRILAYRREHGLSPLPHPPAVLIQRMVAPRAAGVAFGADPVPAAAASPSSAPCLGSAPPSSLARRTPTPGTSIAPARSSSGASSPKRRMHVADPDVARRRAHRRRSDRRWRNSRR